MDSTETFQSDSDAVNLRSDSRESSRIMESNPAESAAPSVPAARPLHENSQHEKSQHDRPASEKRQGDDRTANAKELLRRMYAPIIHPLAQVEQRLRDELQSPFESIADVLRHGIQLGGKRLRPAIHLLMAESLGGVTKANVVIATVLEMVHTATLVHDDVLDSAETRRHVPTINAHWNNHTSILLGDYLFAQSFRLAATLDNTRTCQWVGEASRLVCEGELRQVLHRDNLEMDESTYIDIIHGKTAELCRVACSLAAAEAGAQPDQVERLSQYGSALGIAFQIADDHLDLWGDDGVVGKTLGTDLEQGKITLPIIRLLRTSSTEDQQRILEILNGPPQSRRQEILPWMERSDAYQYTLDAAVSYKRQAIAALSSLPDSSASNCLREIAEFSVRRSF